MLIKKVCKLEIKMKLDAIATAKTEKRYIHRMGTHGHVIIHGQCCNSYCGLDIHISI